MVSLRPRSERPSASSASAAQAALTVGWCAATSAGGLPAASSASASGFGGSNVAGGSPSRLCECVTESARRRLAGRQQVLARRHDALGHARLGRLQVAAWVVDLLVADLAVDLQDA